MGSPLILPAAPRLPAHLSAVVGCLLACGLFATAARAAAPATVPVTPSSGVAPSPGAKRAAELSVVATPDGGLELRSGGGLLAKLPVATPALRRGVPRAQELEVDGHRVVEVRLPIRGRPAEEIWIGEIGGKAPRVIWSGIAGPRDADEETAIFVEATPEHIIEYQTAAQVTRCDGEPVRLLPRAWDFGSGRFRPILSTPPPAAAVKLTARRGDPAMPSGRPLGGFHFTAASTTAAAGSDARGLAAPTALDDGDPKTVWAEGLGGDGRGEFLTARATAGSYRVRGFRIVPGDASTPAAFKARNRIKALAVALGPDADRRFEVEFLEDPAAAAGKSNAPYWIALPSPVVSACVTVTIRDIFRGGEAGPAGGGGTTAISDFQVFTELDEPAGAERLVADMAAGPDCAARVPLLAALGEPAVLPTAQAILGASGVGRECLVEALTRIEATPRSGVALDALAAALVGASANEEKLIIRALRNVETPPVRAVAELLASPRSAGEDRARAARVLGEFKHPDAAAALLAAAGTNGPEARLAVVQALGRSPVVTAGMVVAASDGARASAGGGGGGGAAPGGAASDGAAVRRQADLLRALPTLARRDDAQRADTIQVLRRASAVGQPFEVRARAVLAMGELRDPVLIGELASLRDNSDDPVLRFLATRELGGAGGPAAVAALRTALADHDPRVRETAAQGLGQHRDTASEALLITAAKEEPWPFARRAQIEALSRTCGQPARELLVRAMQRDVDEVRRAALVGLVRCKDPRARPTLLSTLKARRASATLRELAGALLGETGERAVAKDLAELVPGLVNEAEADLAIEGVTVAALRSLGRLGGPDAAHVAARLALDTRHPYRHIAIEVLGDICDPDTGAKTLALIRAGSDAALAAVAQSSEHHCRVGERTPPRSNE